MSEKLLPCPFCGSLAEMKSAVGECWAGCIRCGIGTPMYSSPERGAAKWNARVPATVQAVVSDALADALSIDFRLAADILTARSHVDGQRLLRGWNAMRAALVAALGQR